MRPRRTELFWAGVGLLHLGGMERKPLTASHDSWGSFRMEKHSEISPLFLHRTQPPTVASS